MCLTDLLIKDSEDTVNLFPLVSIPLKVLVGTPINTDIRKCDPITRSSLGIAIKYDEICSVN